MLLQALAEGDEFRLLRGGQLDDDLIHLREGDTRRLTNGAGEARQGAQLKNLGVCVKFE